MATKGTEIRESVGNMTLRIISFSAITTADTWDSGLGNNIITYHYQAHGATETGSCISNAAGTITFYNSGVTGAGDVFLYTKD
jgi:hypothetical protein